MLDKKDFLQVVKNTPLVSIDLIVRSGDDGILMGKRVNQPAAGYWFVPGGVIQKNETLEEAFRRISLAELGQEISLDEGQLLCPFTHLYDTNFAGEPGVGTHYVVLAYEIERSFELKSLPKEQHGSFQWIYASQELDQVHRYSRLYFDYLTKRD